MAAPSSNGLDNTKFVSFALKSRSKYNHNTDEFVFRLHDDNAALNLPVSSCIMTRFVDADGKEVIRPYTPIRQHEKGVLTLLIKFYEKGVMSKHIHSLKVGDSLEIKGPMAKKPYEANKWKNVAMIAGGTGITPMLQIIEAVESNPEDKTQLLLLFANISAKDVLLRETIDAFVAKRPGQLKVVYITTEKEEGQGWIQEHGVINKDLLEKYLPKPDPSVLIYTCGPPGFMNAISGDKNPDKTQGPLIGYLKDLGYNSDMVCKQ